MRKHHRRGKGWANRVVKYDPELPGLRWKSSKWWDSSGGQVGFPHPFSHGNIESTPSRRKVLAPLGWFDELGCSHVWMSAVLRPLGEGELLLTFPHMFLSCELSNQNVTYPELKCGSERWRLCLSSLPCAGPPALDSIREARPWFRSQDFFSSSSPPCLLNFFVSWQLPLRDVLDVERSGKVVWVKCLHLGTVGFEASLESDSVIFYLAMDSLLNKRCGVDERMACITGPVL